MSPKAEHELARAHVETVREDLGGERERDAVNALFYAAEAAVVALADVHGIETNFRMPRSSSPPVPGALGKKEERHSILAPSAVGATSTTA